ncbi:MAG: sortase [Candidatus Levybacteria bacterium]|nr:sortase [Candidatus Levybacteria bacterium]
MTKIYRKKNPLLLRKLLRFVGLTLCIVGLAFAIYFSIPLILFQIYLQPVFASQKIAAPVPKYTILTDSSFQSLLQATTDSIKGIDYTNAQNWYPSIKTSHTDAAVTSYAISIPKIHIVNAMVSTIDNDLSTHLVQYGGTAVPPSKGTAVIFGHSTLPQFYKEGDYKTIFANAHALEIGDEIIIKVNNMDYHYKIYNLTITTPTDTSFFDQQYDNNYLTLVTCTPPGTTWKRLIIKSKIIHPNDE